MLPNDHSNSTTSSLLIPPGPSSSSFTRTSSPSYIKQCIIAVIAICVIGYLAIVYFEVSPSKVIDPLALSSSARSLFALSSTNCHQHYHQSEDGDEVLTADEHIDHLLYRTLKIAIHAGDEKQAAAIAVEITRAYMSKHNINHPNQTTSNNKGNNSNTKKPQYQTKPHKEPIPPPPPVKPLPLEEAVAKILANRSHSEWDEYYKNEEHHKAYIMRDSYHLNGYHVFKADGCKDLDGEQCSADSIEEAMELCDKYSECGGIVCNKGRKDCQLRVAPFTHHPQGGFRSFYKNSWTLAASDILAREKMARELALMQPGSTAADHFDFDGICGEKGYKCVISYGLYGSSSKYVDGALENIKLQPKIFPGWIVRIYHDHSVPEVSLKRLKAAGAELVDVESMNLGGDIAGMFWRFLVADDDTVDRYMVRDTDSRLNEREAAAVKEWMSSGYSIHSIRDHPNHDRPLNGGLWGGVKGSIKNIRGLIQSANRNGYGADLYFLCDVVWPLIMYDQIAHDSYSCYKYLNSVPFPTKRPDNFQHVGQVYEDNRPREGDITCCLLNNPNPTQCRKDPTWLYG